MKRKPKDELGMFDREWWTERDFHPSVARRVNRMAVFVAALVVAQIIYWLFKAV